MRRRRTCSEVEKTVLGCCILEVCERTGIDARKHDDAADSVNDDEKKSINYPLLQFLDFEDVLDGFNKLVHLLLFNYDCLAASSLDLSDS